ncbi:hypothetical protein Hsc_3224 [Herbaspirillum seropedicae]|nr:hypothetical protein Hsc_3224 [Herbaspirillum seropedicae]
MGADDDGLYRAMLIDFVGADHRIGTDEDVLVDDHLAAPDGGRAGTLMACQEKLIQMVFRPKRFMIRRATVTLEWRTWAMMQLLGE